MFDTKISILHRRLKWANSDQKFYFGFAELTFKERYSNQKRDVKHIKCQYIIQN